MTSPTCQDSAPLQEWAPLTSLLQKIPAKIQIGLFAQDINFTCIDAVTEFIAVGNNHGLVYWYNRKTGELETLGCENANSSVTCVKIVSTVDYMVAAGDNQGVVTIFQIPKPIPDSLPEILKPKKKKQVERFNISGLHKTAVTAVEWSKNGMKLFSGDENGLVVLTEMDFYLHLSKSTELLNEKYSVVQLSYQGGLLLISTLFRTIIVNRNQGSQITQVGQKERKTLGKLGAVFSRKTSQIQGPIIYSSRPGLRIWQADKNGTVLKTLILKEAVKIAQTGVKLLNPVSDSSKRRSRGDPTFGIIMPFSDDLLVTYNEDIIYVVNPTAITITSIVTDLRRITGITCTEDEIFVLEGERNIVRIACYPEITSFDTVQEKPLDQLTQIASKFTSKLKSSPIVPAIPFHKITPTNLIQSTSILSPVVIGIDTTSIINAEEAIEIPPIVPLKLNTHLVTGIDTLRNQDENSKKITDRKDIFQKIAEQDFEEVVFTPQRQSKKLLLRVTNAQSSEIEKPKSTIENDFVLESERNLETIEKAVQDKEKLLSTYLNLDLTNYMDKSKICTNKTNSCSSIDSCEYTNDFVDSWIKDRNRSTSTLESVKQEPEQENYKTKLIKLNDSVGSSKQVLETRQVNQQLWRKKPDLEDAQVSETHFNALSKEFVKATKYQDNDDWILLG